jgi:ankyrin repeat protein
MHRESFMATHFRMHHSQGHDVIVQLLLDKGADVNAEGGLYGNVLWAASSNGNEAIVQLLLDKGACTGGDMAI